MSKPSLCNSCVDPGHCCRAFTVNRLFPIGMNRVSVQKHVREGTDPYGKFTTDKMPFVPLRTSTFYTARGQHKPGSVVWLFMCPKLDRLGRCTIYSRRPKICRIYEPGCDRMCAHYTGKWKGSMRLYEEKKEK